MNNANCKAFSRDGLLSVVEGLPLITAWLLWYSSLDVLGQYNSDLCTENQIYKGLDDEESTFLNFVAERQAEMEAKQFEEELEELKEYRISSSTAKLHAWLHVHAFSMDNV